MQFVGKRHLAAAALALAVSMNCAAGTFSVTPVRIYMNTKDRAVAVTIVTETIAYAAIERRTCVVNVLSVQPRRQDAYTSTRLCLEPRPPIAISAHRASIRT